MKKSIIKGVILLLIIIPLVRCGNSTQDSGSFGKLPRKETLIADMGLRVGAPGNFNEWVGYKWRHRGMQNLANEPLWSIDFVKGKIINGLASGDPVYSSDFKTVTIHLREGVAWTDGKPFTSDDVVFTVKTLMNHEGFNDHTFFADNVESITASDKYTVVFNLRKSNSRFHTRFLDRWGCCWIMPKHIFEKAEDPVKFEFNPFVGTGPYKLHSFDPNGYWIIWEKRADWEKSPTGILFGEPKPRLIVFQAFANEGAKILAQLTNDLDAAGLSIEGLKAALNKSESIRSYQKGFPWVVNNDPCITGLTFNTVKPPFDNPDVRWALLLAINIGEYESQAVDSTATLSPVHIPAVGSYPEDYIKPMQTWLKDFTLDLGNGEKFKPYDPDASKRILEYAKKRGYKVPEDPIAIEKAFGIGWYKFAPDAAEKLLKKNGFKKDEKDKWLLPDGKPWKLEIITGSDMSFVSSKNGVAAAQQWKKFGIDVRYFPSDNFHALTLNGEFDVSVEWPAEEPWGAGVDLYRTIDFYNSEYIRPVGTNTQGHTSRWSSEELDSVISDLRDSDPNDKNKIVKSGIEGLKILVENMPGIPTFGAIEFGTWNETYWTNWPGSENPYAPPGVGWGNFKYVTPRLEQVEK